jgi:hypothetical protein
MQQPRCADCAHFLRAKKRFLIYHTGDCMLKEIPCFSTNNACEDFTDYKKRRRPQ